MKKKVLFWFGWMLIIVIVGWLFMMYQKNDTHTNVNLKITKPVKKVKKEIKKPIPAEKVVEHQAKLIEELDLSTNYVYSDTALWLADKVMYNYSVWEVDKPKYEATEDEKKKWVIVFKNLKPNTLYHYKVWLDGDLYASSTFKTKPKNYKKLEEIEKKKAELTDYWWSIDYSRYTGYLYTNWKLAFAKTGIKYKLYSSGSLLEEKVVPVDRLWSGYILIKGLKPANEYKIDIYYKNKKIDSKSFKTDVLPPSVEVKNQTGVVIENNQVNIPLKLNESVKKIIYVKLTKQPEYKKIEKEVVSKYTWDLTQCLDLTKRLFKQTATSNTEAGKEITPLIPYLPKYEELSGEDKKKIEDIKLYNRCKKIWDKLQKQVDEKIKLFQKEEKIIKIEKKVDNVYLSGLDNSNYNVEIIWQAIDGTTGSTYIFLQTKQK